ncbi:hypothetical protein EBA01_12305 [Xanthomonas oryzae pv. oryzae]|nr:hypothetical protein C0L89_12300 [Xanthomonas oryzae pv. oryzae]AVU03076.1 hypothetical protein C0L90_12460 [Xanthomonas oryzae pv. oryzae]QBN24815.1 hypothetical protein EBA00_10130 [Xanthomonas oryzae pv. oryzae]QBN28698.1 hypothetical protein EBA01_12305 [Xanthomonas oryzae pv. oryzae]QBN32224.1 hypothetical protein EBA02_11485 [Xanthomonas oryzae pv. oryzae]
MYEWRMPFRAPIAPAWRLRSRVFRRLRRSKYADRARHPRLPCGKRGLSISCAQIGESGSTEW